ncbi:MAG TPA: GNAT family N-acetyltransferase [Steroidobacteraceae bacterium]
MADALLLRSATRADAPSLLAIYRPFVESTSVSFEEEPPSIEQFAARIEQAVHGWSWIVAEREGRCIGYAYGSKHRERAAYRWSVEVSAYVHPDQHRRGVASTLYGHLFEALANRGFCNAYAAVTMPNEASLALHRKLGFQPIGVFERVGYKFGRWHDVAWVHRVLRDTPP